MIIRDVFVPGDPNSPILLREDMGGNGLFFAVRGDELLGVVIWDKDKGYILNTITDGHERCGINSPYPTATEDDTISYFYYRLKEMSPEASLIYVETRGI